MFRKLKNQFRASQQTVPKHAANSDAVSTTSTFEIGREDTSLPMFDPFEQGIPFAGLAGSDESERTMMAALGGYNGTNGKFLSGDQLLSGADHLDGGTTASVGGAAAASSESSSSTRGVVTGGARGGGGPPPSLLTTSGGPGGKQLHEPFNVGGGAPERSSSVGSVTSSTTMSASKFYDSVGDDRASWNCRIRIDPPHGFAAIALVDFHPIEGPRVDWFLSNEEEYRHPDFVDRLSAAAPTQGGQGGNNNVQDEEDVGTNSLPKSFSPARPVDDDTMDAVVQEDVEDGSGGQPSRKKSPPPFHPPARAPVPPSTSARVESTLTHVRPTVPAFPDLDVLATAIPLEAEEDSWVCCNKVKLSPCKGSMILRRMLHDSCEYPPPSLLPSAPPPPPPSLHEFCMIHGAATWETFHFVTCHSWVEEDSLVKRSASKDDPDETAPLVTRVTTISFARDVQPLLAFLALPDGSHLQKKFSEVFSHSEECVSTFFLLPTKGNLLYGVSLYAWREAKDQSRGFKQSSVVVLARAPFLGHIRRKVLLWDSFFV